MRAVRIPILPRFPKFRFRPRSPEKERETEKQKKESERREIPAAESIEVFLGRFVAVEFKSADLRPPDAVCTRSRPVLAYTFCCGA